MCRWFPWLKRTKQEPAPSPKPARVTGDRSEDAWMHKPTFGLEKNLAAELNLPQTQMLRTGGFAAVLGTERRSIHIEREYATATWGVTVHIKVQVALDVFPEDWKLSSGPGAGPAMEYAGAWNSPPWLVLELAEGVFLEGEPASIREMDRLFRRRLLLPPFVRMVHNGAFAFWESTEEINGEPTKLLHIYAHTLPGFEELKTLLRELDSFLARACIEVELVSPPEAPQQED